jgi:NADH-quinone oxidoreductase subunit L
MIGVVGIVIAWALYSHGPSHTVEKLTEEHGALHGAYVASRAKLWFDEVYDVLIVRPFRGIARGLYEIADRFIIDTVAVNGSAFVVGLFGRVSRWIQNGNVQRYLVGFTIGAAAIVLVTDCHRHPTFDYRFEGANGEMLHLRAQPGAGIASAGAKLRWDIDGDGKPDIEGKDVTVRAGDVGARVTLYIDDPITQKTEVITRDIRAEEVKP